jgi:hypothetical protein
MLVVCVVGLVARFAGAAEPAVRPLATHPGNIFLAGESVTVPLPKGESADWQLVDYDGKVIKEGQAAQGKAGLGELPAGYYELKRKGGDDRIAIGVLMPLQVRPSADSPIGIDVAMSWFYRDEQQMAAAANFCALAGINWVRDRLNWGEMEPTKGQFAGPNRYDRSARIQSAAGLRILQVNHIAPAWTGCEPKRFAPDLRDVYRFYREMAKRWKGQVLAFEPWNEADIDVFGGHTGAEMASLQKAAYLGLKEGNPDMIASLNVFAINRKATLDDLAANEAWPYFDTCDLHHYIALDQYPAWYASFRAICAGRPMWVTEFSTPVQWSGDEKKQELSEENQREQAERVTKVMAASLHEGPRAAFYFMLPHYTEGKTQFGILRADLTPRPAFVAMAAVGRLLAGAKPMGKMIDGNLKTYAFRAKPDGQEREVLVMWSKQEETASVSDSAKVFDHLGRPVAIVDGKIKVTRPVYVVMPVGTLAGKTLTPAPQQPAWKEGKPSPIVLQATRPADQMVLSRSAYRVSSQKRETIPVFVYNFGNRPAKGKLSVSGPATWKMSLADTVEIGPGDRMELPLTLDCSGPIEKPVEAIVVRGDFGDMGQAILSIRVQPEPMKLPEKATLPIGAAAEADRWQQEISGGSTLKLSQKQGGGIILEAKLGPGDRWIYPRLDFRPDERPTGDVTALHFKLTAIEGKAQYRVIFVKENGASYVGDVLVQPQPGQSIDAAVILSDAILGAGWSLPDPEGRLNPQKIKAIKIGCNTKAENVKYEVSDVKWLKW